MAEEDTPGSPSDPPPGASGSAPPRSSETEPPASPKSDPPRYAKSDPPPRVPSEPAPPMLAVTDTAIPEAPPSADDPAPSDRVTEELARATREMPRRLEAPADDDAPTLEIEAAAPSIEVETLRRPEVEGAPASEKPAATKKSKRNVGRWLVRIAVALVALITAFAIVLAVAFDSIARWYVTFEAERRGITIEARDMKVEWGRATFWDATIRLDGAPALALHAEWLEVEALGLHPTNAQLRGLEVEATTIDAIRQGLAFGRVHGSDLVPVTIKNVHAVLGKAPGALPTLDAKVAEVSFEPGEPLFARGAVATVARPKLVLGPVDVVADASGSLVRLGLGADLAKSPVKVETDLDSRQLSIELGATPASTIAGWMGRKQVPNAPPWPGAFSIKTKVTGSWTADVRGDLVGHVDATLIGIVPPHPPELNGIATGSDTVTSFDFRMGPRDEGIALDKLHVEVGRLRLDGTGRIVPREPSFVATATLRGSIPCQELVGTVAVQQLGSTLGGPLGSLVRSSIAGNVDVTVAISVDGEHVASPDVRPSAAIGCRLRLL